jgi:hypothetical protein
MALSLKPVEASRGPRWIGDAFRLFARRPVAFASLFAAFMLAAVVASFVPVLGSAVQMMALPLLSLGFMVAGQSALLQGPVTPLQFIEPLKGNAQRRQALLTLCGIYGLCALLILLLADGVSNSAWERLQKLIAQGDGAQPEIDALLAEPGVLTGAVLGVSLGAVLSVPFWHAPALVHWGGQGVRQALFSSTLAVWRCKGAFVTYLVAWVGVITSFAVGTALLFVALGMPQMAGVVALPSALVFSTVFYLSGLFTFTDSFGGSPSMDPVPPTLQ